MSQIPNGALVYNAKIKKAFEEVLAAPELNPKTIPFISSMQSFAETYGFLTEKQASKLGT